MQATSEVAYLFPYNSFFFPPFLFPLLPFRPFLSSLFLMFRWWGASELNLMQGTREKTRGDWVKSKETRFVPFFTLVSCLFFPLVNFSPAPHHLNAWNWLLLIQPPLPRILSLLQRPCFICISRYHKLEAILILSSVDTYLQSNGIQREIPGVSHRIIQGIFNSFQLRSIFLQKLPIFPQLCLSDDFYKRLRFD